MAAPRLRVKWGAGDVQLGAARREQGVPLLCCSGVGGVLILNASFAGAVPVLEPFGAREPANRVGKLPLPLRLDAAPRRRFFLQMAGGAIGRVLDAHVRVLDFWKLRARPERTLRLQPVLRVDRKGLLWGGFASGRVMRVQLALLPLPSLALRRTRVEPGQVRAALFGEVLRSTRPRVLCHVVFVPRRVPVAHAPPHQNRQRAACALGVSGVPE
mmetsp:Transcript_83869/g.167952  ORF Transcript_83869/g.167952 Transcript_83869/m.167952 type:complete len:214 (-) Transcript_83869:711-1352(-)